MFIVSANAASFNPDAASFVPSWAMPSAADPAAGQAAGGGYVAPSMSSWGADPALMANPYAAPAPPQAAPISVPAPTPGQNKTLSLGAATPGQNKTISLGAPKPGQNKTLSLGGPAPTPGQNKTVSLTSSKPATTEKTEADKNKDDAVKAVKAAVAGTNRTTDEADKIVEDAMTSGSALTAEADEATEKALEKLSLEDDKASTTTGSTTLKATEKLDLGPTEVEAAPADEAEPEVSTRLRRHVNVVFIGHVDAGKSTIAGQVMYLTGGVDDRTLDKYEREAKAKNREGWKFAWAMDLTDTERAKGKTEEVGKASFSTENKEFTILDAPGHKSFIPHMIGGASQADIGILVISARRGEFEAGFDKGGQTREHAMLAKTAGVRQLIVVINKMDESTVEWSKERYDECVTGLTPYLKQVGYNPKTDITFLPVSGLLGINVKDPLPEGTAPWYEGPPLLELLDGLKPPDRLFNVPLRMPIIDKYKDMGTVVHGKLESGTIKVGEKLVVMPNRNEVEVVNIAIETHEIDRAEPGDNVKIKLKGVEEEDIRAGFVLCRPGSLVTPVTEFDAQIILLETKTIITAGYSCVMHVHAAIEEVEIKSLIALVDKKTNTVTQKRPRFVKSGQTVRARLALSSSICVERYKDFAQLGRFMLRDEGKTIGVGVVVRLVDGSNSTTTTTST